MITVIFAAASMFPVGATANTIVGGLDFSGNVTLTTDDNPASPTFGDGTLTFDPEAGQSFDFTVDSGTGFFSALTGGGDAASFGAATAPISNTPNVNIPFLTFVNSPVTFTITNVFPGVDGPGGCSANIANAANGNICSPAGTPFNLQDLAPNGTNSSATFVLAGYLVSGGTDTLATITFTASSTGTSLEQLLKDQENGVPDVITYGAQLVTVAPEPASYSLMLAGGFLLAGGIFRRRKTR